MPQACSPGCGLFPVSVNSVPVKWTRPFLLLRQSKTEQWEGVLQWNPSIMGNIRYQYLVPYSEVSLTQGLQYIAGRHSTV